MKEMDPVLKSYWNDRKIKVDDDIQKLSDDMGIERGVLPWVDLVTEF